MPLILIVCISFISCSSDNDQEPKVLSGENNIVRFEIPESGIETEITEDKLLIYAFPSRHFRDFMFLPIIEISDKATLYSEPSIENFSGSNSIRYRVSAENGSIKDYNTETIVKNGIVEINVIYKTKDTSGETLTVTLEGTIDEVSKIIEFNFKLDILDEIGSTIQLDIITKGEVTTTPSQDDVIDLTLDTLIANIDGEDVAYIVKFIDFIPG